MEGRQSTRTNMAPSAVDATTFPNKKVPTIAGTDTHAAKLKGSVSLSLLSRFGRGLLDNGTSTSVSSVEIVLRTMSIDYTKAINEAIITYFQDVNVTPTITEVTIRLRRGGIADVIIDSIIGTVDEILILNATESDRPIGNQIYTITAQTTFGPASTFVSNYDDWSGDVILSEVNDTHAANLTGSPGISTAKNKNIISG